jgi:hypothetical protein
VTYIRLDDGFLMNTAMRKLGLAGRSLYIAGLCHCSRELTDGTIAKEVVDVLCTQAQVTEKVVGQLVDAGRWIDEGDHYRVHDYLEHQRSREQVERERARNRRNVTAYRHRVTEDVSGGVTEDVSGLLTGGVSETSARTESETDTDKEREGAQPASNGHRPKRRATRIPQDFTLSEAMRNRAKEAGMDQQTMEREFLSFCDWHTAKGSQWVDWPRAWGTWVGRWAERHPKAANGLAGWMQ